MAEQPDLQPQAGLSRWIRGGAIGLFGALLGLTVVMVWQDACRLPMQVRCGTPWLWLQPLGIACIYGSTALLLTRQQYRRADALIGWLIGMTLISGLLSAINAEGGVRLFYLCMTWLAPALYLVHANKGGAVYTRWTGRTLIALATVLTLPPLLFAEGPIAQMPGYGLWRLGVRFALAFSVFATLAVLAHTFQAPRLVVRRQGRQVAFGIVGGILPMVLLSMIPDTLGLPFLPYFLTFWGLILHPMMILCSAWHHQRGRIVTLFEWGLIGVTLFWITAGLTFGRYELHHLFQAQSYQVRVGVETLFTLGVVGVSLTLWRHLRQSIRWILYGRDVNYVAKTQSLLQALALLATPQHLNTILLHDLPQALDLTQSGVWLVSDGTYTPIGSAHAVPPLPPPLQTPASSVRAPIVIERTDGLWVRFDAAHQPYGLFWAGRRPGGDLFTREDHRFLEQIAGPVGVALHNVTLSTRLGTQQAALRQAQRAIVRSGDDERRDVAQTLQTTVLVPLVDTETRLQRAMATADPLPVVTQQALRTQVLQSAHQVRRLIRDLRPAGLSELGLAVAVQGYIAEIQREWPAPLPEIELVMENLRLPYTDGRALVQFRVIQEALKNTLRHAGADDVHILLRAAPTTLEVVVRDNGQGFTVPPRLTDLASRQQFGLMRMAERVAWVQGTFQVQSSPHVGTTITSIVPLAQKGVL